MDSDLIVGAVVMMLCSFGCGALFVTIGRLAEKARKPFGFWAGKSVPADKVTDVVGYNHANAVMWKTYSTPYWLSGVVSLFGFWGEGFILCGAIILSAACFPGIFFLISHYRKIENKYITK